MKAKPLILRDSPQQLNEPDMVSVLSDQCKRDIRANFNCFGYLQACSARRLVRLRLSPIHNPQNTWQMLKGVT